MPPLSQHFTPTPTLPFSLHDALPISADTKTMTALVSAGLADASKVFAHNKLEIVVAPGNPKGVKGLADLARSDLKLVDRKSTRLNSSHVSISYAVFCLKKKKQARRVC